MPRVPVYDTPEVASQPIAPVQVNLNTQGLSSGFAQGLSSVGQAADQMVSIVKEEKNKADAARTSDGQTKLQAAINNGFYDPQNGLMHKQGEAAVAAAGDLYDNLAKERQNIADNYLENDEQRRVFMLRTGGLLEDAHKGIENHVGQQIHVANQATLGAAIETSLMAVSGAYSSPEIAARQLASVESQVRALQLSPEAGDATIAKFREQVASTRLKQAIDNRDYDWASKFLAISKPDLGVQAGQFERTIEALGDQSYGQQAAQELVKRATDPVSGLFHEDRLSPDLLSQVDPKRSRAVEEAFNPLREQAERYSKATINQNFASAFSVLDATHSLSGVPPATRAWLIQFAPEKWNELETKQRELIHAHSEAPDSTEQTGAYVELRNDMAEHPDAYKAMSTAEFAARWGSRLSERGYKTGGVQLADLKAKPDKDLNLTGQAAKAVTELFSRAYGVPPAGPDKWDEKTQQDWRLVHDYVETQATDWSRQHHGSTPSLEQYGKWANEKLVKGKVPGSGVLFDDTVTRLQYEQNPKYQGKAFVRDIPSQTSDAIKAKFKAKGIKPTDDQVRAVFEKLNPMGGQ